MGRGRAPCCAKVGLNKGSWTPEEDVRLITYIQKYGHGNWRALPKHAGLLRCGKSCRLRWINYLRPDIKRGNFTKEEEETIVKLHDLLGNKWSKIASFLPGRTDNEIKNVWNTHLKKRLALSSKEAINEPTAALGNNSEQALSSNSSSASCNERDQGKTDKEGDRSTEILKPNCSVDDEVIEIPIDTGMDHLWSLLDGDQSNITPSSSSSVELVNCDASRDRLRKDEEAKDHHQLTTISDLAIDPDIWSMIGDDDACSFTPELETMEALHSDGQLSNYTCDWLEYLEEELELRSETAAAMNNQESSSKMEGDNNNNNNNNNNVSCCFQTRPFSPSHLDHVDFRVS